MLAKAATDDEMRTAAEYYASLKPKPWLRIVEADIERIGAAGRIEKVGRYVDDLRHHEVLVGESGARYKKPRRSGNAYQTSDHLHLSTH